jgi:hypothetical protein
MSPEQRITIAEAHGWKGISPQLLVGYAPWRKEPYSDRVNACPIDELDCIPLDPIPDYPFDLNAVHEVEKILTPEQWVSYQTFLDPLACRPITALQRCLAIIQTLQLTHVHP